MHVCKNCGYVLKKEENEMMLDGNLFACPHCGIQFGEKPPEKLY